MKKAWWWVIWGAAGCAGDDARPLEVPPGMDASEARVPDASARDAGVRDASPRDAGMRDDFTDARVADASDSQVAAGADAGCDGMLVGWASVSGDGIEGTTGGGTVTPVRPKDAAELQRYASAAEPQVIELVGSFDVPELRVASNKTLRGIGSDATLHGGLTIAGKAGAPVQNVVVQNLHIDGATAASQDAVHVEYAHHLWFDHCDVYDGPDGSLDMTHAANWITVSWTILRYTANYHNAPGEEVSAHRFASLIGHSDDNGDEDRGRLRVSFHHNHWADGVLERMPRVRFGQVHVFDNYFHAPGNHHCVRAGREAALLIEQNYFEEVASPHQFNSDADQKTASITARDNVYLKTTGDQSTGGGGPAFSDAPYPVSIDPAAAIPALVQRCAGPR